MVDLLSKFPRPLYSYPFYFSCSITSIKSNILGYAPFCDIYIYICKYIPNLFCVRNFKVVAQNSKAEMPYSFYAHLQYIYFFSFWLYDAFLDCNLWVGSLIWLQFVCYLVDMDQRKKLVVFLTLRELHLQKMDICVMLFVMLCTLAQRYVLRKRRRTTKRARVQTSITDQQDTTGNEVSTDGDGLPEVISPALENRTSATAQNANQSQTSRRKKRKRSQWNDIASGLREISETFKQMKKNSDENMDRLVECLTNNHEKDWTFMFDELK